MDESESTCLLRFRLMLGELSDTSEANRKWENQGEEFRQFNSYRESLGIDGEPIEFEWNIFPGLTSLEILQNIQGDLQERNIEPEDFEDRIIFMLMFNDIEETKKGHLENCISNSEQVKMCAERFSRGYWTFLGAGDEKKWYGSLSDTPEGKWSFHSYTDGGTIQTGHPVF